MLPNHSFNPASSTIPVSPKNLQTSLSGLELILSIAIGLFGVLLPAEEGMAWHGLTPGEAEGGGLGEGAPSSGANLFP